MTIQEAIKSGKPFRRKEEFTLTHRWIGQLGNLTGNIFWDSGVPADCGLTAQDILAEDWEVKE